MNVLFSDHYRVDKKIVEEYGAFNISMLSDLPLFIDPFLLFHSDKTEYKALHERIIRYLNFLREKSVSGRVTPGLLAEWYKFKEVKQTWLGFSKTGNRGSGLGDGFARALDANFHLLFGTSETDPVQITKGRHLEKLCLIREGVGRDNISDFTTNLIKEFLCEYTQTFARTHMSARLCKEVNVGRVRFNYQTEAWQAKPFYLPRYGGEYILLAPRDILTRDQNWINREDLLNDFESLPEAIPDQNLRAAVNNYFMMALPDDADKKERRKAAADTIQKFPQVIDYFIRRREDDGDQAVSISTEKVNYAEDLFLKNFTDLVSLVAERTDFYTHSFRDRESALARAEYLKEAVERHGGYRFLYDIDRNSVSREDYLEIARRFLWFTVPADVDGLPVILTSEEIREAYPVTFKLGNNKSLINWFQKKDEESKNPRPKEPGVTVVFCFKESEVRSVTAMVADAIRRDEAIGDVIIIDGARDSKSEEKAMAGKFDGGYALVVGVAKYANIDPLPDAVAKDAVDIGKLLRDPARCGYPSENVRTLLDKDATAEGIRDGLKWLAASAGPDATAIIFFSGHGARIDRDDQNFIIPYDFDQNQWNETTISGDELTKMFRAVQAQRLVVAFDSCHSGGSGEAKNVGPFGVPGVKEGLGESYLGNLAHGTGRVILASSRSDEESLVYVDMGNSLFTNYLLEALRGETRDRGDGLVRIFDVFEYVSEKVPARSSGKQHPIFKASDVEDNFPVSLYRGGKKAVPGSSIVPIPRPRTEVNKTALREAIIEAFSRAELDALCSDIQQNLADDGISLTVDTETVGGMNKPDMVLKLIEYLNRRGSLSCLVAAVRKARPGVI